MKGNRAAEPVEAETTSFVELKKTGKKSKRDGEEQSRLKREKREGIEQDGMTKDRKRKMRDGKEQSGLKRKSREGVEQDGMTKVRKRKKSSLPSTSDADDGAEGLPTEAGNLHERDDVKETSMPNSLQNKYVPPHLRELETVSEETVRLQRRIRGLLNRLSEANVESITSDIATIYQAHGRLLVTGIVSKEVVGACCEGPRGNDQYAAVFAAFVAGMSAISGIDFGAKFVAALAISFEEQYHKGDSLAMRNMALLLSHLYNFSLLPSDLLYEVLGVLCKRFEELDVATILTILQSCGMGLRGDNPIAMKDFVISIQERTAEAKAALLRKNEGTPAGLSKRVQFMLDTICDIKNNKRPSKESAPHIHLKKWLQKLGIGEVALRAVTWKRLLDPDRKGQWWLPSALDLEHRTDIKGEVAGTMDIGIMEADKMLQLAASQRMNTESRRAVFCMVMSGEDYVDAFEKILRLKLPGTQDREVMRVIVECCLQEKLFNKYYTLLASKLCDHEKNHKFTLQYCLWDQFKQLSGMELRRIANLGRFLAHMIGSNSLSLAVLKPVDFSDPQVMTPKVVMHFRIFLNTLLTEYSEEVIWNCFSRVASPPKLAPLRDGLSAFLPQLTKLVGENQGEKEQRGILTKRSRLANKALVNVTGAVLR